MKRTIVTILIFLLPTLLVAQWAIGIGGTLNDNSWSIGVDDFGNTYITGYFEGDLDFDPGPGVFKLVNEGFWDTFIAKYSPNGSLIWAKSIGGTLFNYATTLSIFVEGNGNIFITGEFAGTVDFDPSPGIFNLTEIGNNDIFFAKYTTDGNFVWAKNVGGVLADNGADIMVDNSGKVLVTGEFAGTADFDPGSAIFNLTSSGNSDIFMAKYDDDGSLLWATKIDGNSFDSGNTISIDDVGNIFIAGSFQGTVDFDPGLGNFNITSNGNNDFFVAKYSTNGDFIWAKSFGGSSSDVVYNFAVDNIGNSFVTGYFQGTVDFNPSSGTSNLTSSGSYDIFALKLDSDGNYIWAKNFGSAAADIGYSITHDGIGSIYLTGYFSATVDFDPGSGITDLLSNGSIDVFILKLSSDGDLVWAKNVGGTSADVGTSIKIDGIGNIYITGAYSSTADFDPGSGILNLAPFEAGDIFIAKYSSDGSLLNECVEIKIFLEGPSNSLNMNHTLDSSIPLSQPYSVSPWNYNGGEITTLSFLTTHNIVDWVYLELRSGASAATATNVVSRRAALLRNDGVIIDPDGTAAIDFSGVGSGNYFITVFHRNHLTVMSSNAVSF